MKQLFVAAAASLLACAAAPTCAQGFPTRPIVMVVPFAAGGPTDTLARIMAERMGRAIGGTMVVENTVGAAGSIGGSRRCRLDRCSQARVRPGAPLRDCCATGTAIRPVARCTR